MGEEKGEEKKEEKKEDGPITIVLKVNMHCNCKGCANKVKKSVKDLPGVNNVKTELSSNKITVVGKVDPKMVCERVQTMSQNKVELISPQPKKEEGENKKQQQKPEDKEKSKEKGEEKKEKEKDNKEKEKDNKEKEKEKEKPPPVITTVLKVYLHCEACANLVKKAILKFKGTQTAEPDLNAQNVTVKGTMDPNKLAEYLRKKAKKHVEVVPQKEKKEDKKEGEKKDGGEKKEGGGGDKKKDGGEKKDGEGKKKDGGDESKGGGDGNEESKGEGHKNEAPYIPTRYMNYYGPAPQIFSDENPNACSIM